jgi:hypothetical protein
MARRPTVLHNSGTKEMWIQSSDDGYCVVFTRDNAIFDDKGII